MKLTDLKDEQLLDLVCVNKEDAGVLSVMKIKLRKHKTLKFTTVRG